MNSLTEKGKTVADVYLTLWCRVFDESLVEIKSVEELAIESGFSGQRAVSTWKSRMRKLEELGFISIKDGGIGEFSYVLVFNSYNVIKPHNDSGLVQQAKYTALFARAQDVGAKDLTG